VSQAVAESEGTKASETIDNGGVCPTLAMGVAEMKLERAKGFEPSTQNPQPVSNQPTQETASPGCTQIRAQILDELGPELAQVVAAWAKLSPQLKAAILAIVGSVTSTSEGEP